MVKPAWGAKRTCPKCSTRFYDLGKDDPVHCIECGTDFVPEPVLKSKQPMAFEAAPVAAKEPADDKELAADDLAIDEDEEISPDEEVDLDTGDGPRRRDRGRGRGKLGSIEATGFRPARNHFPLFQRGRFRLRARKDVGP